mmetsp:Transcript_10514/g.30026  ORF Transcript_10514/g.30026 Transcript_10514/m.30026 type:complete len:249 (-) Transcript_10514:438-1184(-)
MQGRILAGELDNLLGDDAAQKGSHRTNHARSEERDLADDVLVDLIDGQGTLVPLSRIVQLLRELDASLRGRSVPNGRERSVLLSIHLHRLNGNVQLLRAPELREVGDREVLAALGSRLNQCALVRRERDRLGHLHLSHQSLAEVSRVARRVLYGEGVRPGDPDLTRRGVVELRHALDLPEGDPIPVLEAMPPLVMGVHRARVLLGDAGDYGASGLLTVLVAHGERVPVIDESGAAQPKAVCRDEADLR